MHDWLTAREQQALTQTLSDLIDELRAQHLRIATPKLSPTDQRDPFCFAEDNGVMRFIRGDDPFWTGARFDVLNMLLCSLGLLERSRRARRGSLRSAQMCSERSPMNVSALDTIDGSYSSAVFTTYSLNLRFFEHWVMPLLHAVGARNVVVFADESQLGVALEDHGLRAVGAATR